MHVDLVDERHLINERRVWPPLDRLVVHGDRVLFPPLVAFLLAAIPHKLNDDSDLVSELRDGEDRKDED
jgi:hypothetical protein